MPTSSRQRTTASAGRSTTMPSASRTSALPNLPEAARLPCLATEAPAPAAISAAVVEMLKVPPWSPPVPQVSTSGLRRDTTGVACDRMARAAPTSSSTVSPLAQRAPSRAPIWASVASPRMITSRAPAAATSSRSRPAQADAIAARSGDVPFMRPGPGRGSCAAGACPRPSGSTPGGTARPRAARCDGARP